MGTNILNITSKNQGPHKMFRKCMVLKINDGINSWTLSLSLLVYFEIYFDQVFPRDETICLKHPVFLFQIMFNKVSQIWYAMHYVLEKDTAI